jgi:hypothetical protein
MAKARSLAQNRPASFLEDKASADMIEQLAKDKEIRVSAIVENINNSVSSALVKGVSSAASVSYPWAK